MSEYISGSGEPLQFKPIERGHLSLAHSSDVVSDPYHRDTRLATGRLLFEYYNLITRCNNDIDPASAGVNNSTPVQIGQRIVPRLINTWAFATTQNEKERQNVYLNLDILKRPATTVRPYKLWHKIIYFANVDDPRVFRTGYDFTTVPGADSQAKAVSLDNYAPTHIAVSRAELGMIVNLMLQDSAEIYTLEPSELALVKELGLPTAIR